MADDILKGLQSVDGLLSRIPVSGAAAYLLVDARRELKRVYDLVKIQEKEWAKDG